MGHLRIKANEYNYQECDCWLKEEFINSVNDTMMRTNIVKELKAIKNTN